MTKSNSSGLGRAGIGSSVESWLDEEGIREETTAAAIKATLAEELIAEMERQGLSRSHVAAMMEVSDARLADVLDPQNAGVTIESLLRAAQVLGRRLRLELV